MKKNRFDYKSRIDKLREFLSLKKNEGVLLFNSKDIFYLSGFKGTKAFLLITKDKELLITDFRYFEKFKKDNCFGELFEIKTGYFDDAAGLIFRLKLKKIFLDETKTFCEQYNEFSSRLPQTKFIFKKDITSFLRQVKDNEELEIIREGALKTVEVFQKTITLIKEGITEKELALNIESLLKHNGFEDISFPPIVLFGERASMPHGESGYFSLKKNQPVLIDFGGVYKGYCTDFTRTVFFGKPDSSFENIYSYLLDCQKAVIKNSKTGMKAFQIDAMARECLDKKSLGEFFKHSLGHGVGLDIHEAPLISPFTDITIENGMVFTVEPGVYFEEKFGIRIEDMVEVKNDVLTVLTDFPKELILIG